MTHSLYRSQESAPSEAILEDSRGFRTRLNVSRVRDFTDRPGSCPRLGGRRPPRHVNRRTLLTKQRCNTCADASACARDNSDFAGQRRTDKNVMYSPRSKHTQLSQSSGPGETCAPEAAEEMFRILEGRWNMAILFHLFGGIDKKCRVMRFSELRASHSCHLAEDAYSAVARA